MKNHSTKLFAVLSCIFFLSNNAATSAFEEEAAKLILNTIQKLEQLKSKHREQIRQLQEKLQQELQTKTTQLESALRGIKDSIK